MNIQTKKVMKKISGYVFIKERKNVGIPNLLVEAFDLQKPSPEESSIELTGLSMPYSGKSASNFGLRIGSVITNEEGYFEFNADDLILTNNHRPNLNLVVSAPEDVFDKTHEPIEPEGRILYQSKQPRYSAGAVEAYEIRIPFEVIERFHLFSPDENQKRREYLEKHLNAMDDNEVLKKTIRERLKPKLEEQIKKDEEIKNKVKEKLKNFSTIPLPFRSHTMLLKKPEDLEELQKKSINEGLIKLSDSLEENPFSFRIRMSQKDIESLGIELEQYDEMVNEIEGEIITKKFTKKINSLSGGVDLIRNKDIVPSQITPEALYQKYFNNSNVKNNSADNIE
jgi:hypothetical protein